MSRQKGPASGKLRIVDEDIEYTQANRGRAAGPCTPQTQNEGFPPTSRAMMGRISPPAGAELAALKRPPAAYGRLWGE